MSGIQLGSILAGYYGLNVDISFRFQAIKSFSVYTSYLRSGYFVNFLVIFGYICDKSFSRRIIDIYGNRKFWRFDVVLKLNLLKIKKLKIGRRTPNSCPPTWCILSGAFNCLVVFQNFFSLLIPPLNFVKFRLNSRVPRLQGETLNDMILSLFRFSKPRPATR